MSKTMEIMEENYVALCKTDDLIVDAGVCALINGKQVAVFYIENTPEKVFVIDNYDPIGKANVLYRGIVGSINDELVVASPLYKQHFSLRSGACIEQPEQSVTAYPVRIDAKQINVLVD